MKSPEEMARNVFLARDAQEARRRKRLRRLGTTFTAVGVVFCLMVTAGFGYAFAAGLGIIRDFLGIFGSQTQLTPSQQAYVEEHGYSVVRSFVGHGVGKELHEDPEVPNYGEAGHGPRLVSGMTIAIEPMVNEKSHVVKTLSDGWTVKTADGSLAAHYENTILITDGEPELLTPPDGESPWI